MPTSRVSVFTVESEIVEGAHERLWEVMSAMISGLRRLEVDEVLDMILEVGTDATGDRYRLSVYY